MFHLKDGTAKISSVVRNLRAFFDELMSTSDQVDRLIRTRWATSIKADPTIFANTNGNKVTQLILVISRVDCYKSILAGLPKYQVDCIKFPVNVAAKLIFSTGHHDNDMPLRWDKLHWLRVHQRIEFERSLLVYKVLNGLGLDYLSYYCINKLSSFQSPIANQKPSPSRHCF